MKLPAVGDVLAGKYGLVGVLGRGGMGVVFEGAQRDLDRSVAIKVFADEAEATPNLARFQREIQLLGRLAHPHIVSIFDFYGGDATTPPFVVMELLRGRTLSDLVAATGKLDAPRAARIVQQLLEALDAAHQNGIVHRDVKPSNVFCVDTLHGDFVKLLDFGVAKDLGESLALTGPGKVVGTLSYIAPEQLRGEAAGFQSDVYSAGATLYYLLAGHKPGGTSSGTNVQAALDQEPESLVKLRPDAAALARVVHTALAKTTAARFPTARAMHEAISKAMGGTSISSRPTPGPDDATLVVPTPRKDPADPTLPSAQPPPPSAPAGGMRWGIAAGAAVTLLVIVVACLATALAVVLSMTRPKPPLVPPSTVAVDAGAVAIVSSAPSVDLAVPPPSVSAPSTTQHTTAPPASSTCLCLPVDRENGIESLCPRLDPMVACHCSRSSGVRGCTVPLTTTPTAIDCADDTIKGSALRTGQACNAYFSAGLATEPGTLDCDRCPTQNPLTYKGKTGDACTGFERSTGTSRAGSLDCR